LSVRQRTDAGRPALVWFADMARMETIGEILDAIEQARETLLTIQVSLEKMEMAEAIPKKDTTIPCNGRRNAQS
jgi:hypothetical protein